MEKSEENTGTQSRMLRVTKWLGETPALATCSNCNRVFRVPLTALQKASDAKENLQTQFEYHLCRKTAA